VEAPNFQKQVSKGDRLEFRLFLGPTELPNAKTINDLFEEGCVFVDGMVQAARGGGWPNPTLKVVVVHIQFIRSTSHVVRVSTDR
jgi:hypothetical protein